MKNVYKNINYNCKTIKYNNIFNVSQYCLSICHSADVTFLCTAFICVFLFTRFVSLSVSLYANLCVCLCVSVCECVYS